MDAKWTRETLWRQGAIVLPEAAVELKLISQDEVETAVVVVISHDCDLVTDDLEAEPYIEVIVGRWLEEINGNFTAAKSTRTLHLEIADTNPSTLIELAASRKGIISKACLASYKPRSDLAITGKNLQTLQNWLADRYRRSAFPDELVNRFKPMESVFAKSVKRSVNEILGLFIDYDPDADGLSEDQIYEIYLMVVYDGDTPEGETKALETVGTVTAAFKKHYFNDGKWKSLELKECVALSDTEFTLRDILQTKRYRLEHLSYRQDPSGPVAEIK